VLPHRFFFRPQGSDQGLIDHTPPRKSHPITVCEGPTAQDLDAHRLEVARPDAHYIKIGPFVLGQMAIPLGHHLGRVDRQGEG
jgi:hypothetical protein